VQLWRWCVVWRRCCAALQRESKVSVNCKAPAAPESGTTCQDLRLPSAGRDDEGKRERGGHAEVT
jgi:hypothetical protein